jgi:hypothetical protein
MLRAQSRQTLLQFSDRFRLRDVTSLSVCGETPSDSLLMTATQRGKGRISTLVSPGPWGTTGASAACSTAAASCFFLVISANPAPYGRLVREALRGWTNLHWGGGSHLETALRDRERRGRDVRLGARGRELTSGCCRGGLSRRATQRAFLFSLARSKGVLPLCGERVKREREDGCLVSDLPVSRPL